MKKLEDIPKKEIFTVPDDYFEKLPGMIQSRIAERKAERNPALRYSLQIGLPAVAIAVIAAVWFFNPQPDNSPEGILASIETEDLVAYLNDSDITTDELLENAVLDQTDAEELEEAVYEIDFDDIDLDRIEDLDL